MFLFQFGFMVINNETLQDSIPQSQLTNVAAVRYLLEQEDTFLRDDEFSEVVLLVEHMVVPESIISKNKFEPVREYRENFKRSI